MAVIGKISDNVATANYLPKHMRRLSDLSTSNRINYECTGELHCLIETLPDYLRFSDRNAPVREVWQEVQRTSLGVTYYITQILIFRPALVYATFFDSLTLAQDSIGDRIDIRKYMDLALLSAKNLIGLAHDVFFVRCPSFKRDGNMAFFIISACLTLLFEVLDAETTPAHATEVFHIVEKGLQCLDKIDHIGTTTGRAISLDVMKVAKDALFSTEAEMRLGSNLIEDFAWLNDDAFQLPQDGAGSWLNTIMDIPVQAISGLEDMGMSTQSNILETTDPNQAVLDMMGQGLRFTNNTANTMPF
ncbi:hypothetical protein H2203_003148 [Taxawa tesnikishii (nom. ined.)]|nr:hypothetical protein H2203_003148 [Dothideales sp. JES 119]